MGSCSGDRTGPCLGGWIVPLPGRYGWPPTRVTGLAPCRLGYGTARVSGTALDADSEQKTPFCSESAPFCRFLNKISDFVQIRREMGPLRRQFREGGSKCAKVGPSSRPVLREAGPSARKWGSLRGRFCEEQVQVREKGPLRHRFHEERVRVAPTALKHATERRRGNLKMSGLNRIFMT